MNAAEESALVAAKTASYALVDAIEAYEAAGYGSHVTQPLRDALGLVEFSIREVAQ